MKKYIPLLVRQMYGRGNYPEFSDSSNGRCVSKNYHKRPTKIKIIAKNLVKTINIRENFSKRGDLICLFAKISVSLHKV